MGEESACNAGGTNSIPESGRSPGGGHGNPLQYSCLENPMNRRAWRATVQRVTKSQRRLKRLSTHACTFREPIPESEAFCPQCCSTRTTMRPLDEKPFARQMTLEFLNQGAIFSIPDSRRQSEKGLGLLSPVAFNLLVVTDLKKSSP